MACKIKDSAKTSICKPYEECHISRQLKYGYIEAPYYKLPVVNIGNRQKGRLNADNVSFVPYDEDKIVESIKNAIFNKE